MFGLGKKKATEGGASGPGAGDGSALHLHIRDNGWTARLTRPGADEPQTLGGDGEKILTELKDDPHTGPVLENMFRLAGEAFKGRDGQGVHSVHVLLDDPRLIYCDLRQNQLSTGGATVLRDFGRQQLNCRAVSFGTATFARKGPDGRPAAPGVAAFIDASRLGGFLTRLDRIAPRVSSITPLADIMVRRAVALDGAYAGLSVGALGAQLVVANARYGSVLYRHLPFGTRLLARLLAAGLGIGEEEAAATLAEQDMLADLRPTEADGLDTLSLTPAERALGQGTREFIAWVNESLEFFESQRCAGRPETIEVFGDLGAVRGLSSLMQRLSLPVAIPEVTLFDVFAATPPAERLNLLSEAGADFKIGTALYSFRDQRLLPAEQVRRQAAAAAAAAKQRQVAPKREEPQRRKSGRRQEREREARRGLGDELNQLLARLQGKAAAPEGEPGDAAAASGDKDALGFAAVAALLLLLAWSGWDRVTSESSVQAQGVSSLGAATLLSQTMHNDSPKPDTPMREGDDDKVLWTEKIVALAANMKNEMWITDLYLKSDSRKESGGGSSGGRDQANKALVLEGAVLPSTDGHLMRIGEYIERLQKDQDNFMGDFRDIAFQGMRLDTAETDQVVRFSIEAWYDEKKSRESRIQKLAPQPATLDDAQHNIQQRNKAADQALQGNSGRNQ